MTIKIKLSDVIECLKQNAKGSWKARVYADCSGSRVSYWHSRAF